MKNKIKIGVSAKFHERAPVFYGEAKRQIQYLETSIADWVASNDALPFMLPSESSNADFSQQVLDADGFAQEMDALILQGGVDVHPTTFGSDKFIEGGKYDLIRDKYELALISAFIYHRKPIFGVCRGMQLLNVYFGGDLHTDLTDEGFSQHLDKEKEEKFYHEIAFEPESIFSSFGSGSHRVVSIHHQGIKNLGKGLAVEARAVADGLVECFSKVDEEHFILAVQWHPEFHKDDNVLNSAELMKPFLAAARNRKFYGDITLSRKKKVKFTKSRQLTLGAEIELQIVSAEDFDLCPLAPKLLETLSKKSHKIKSEIFQSMIEIESDICECANEIERDFIETSKLLLAEANKSNCMIAAAGTHPFAQYSERKLTREERYEYIVQTRQWIARRIAIFGLHCHVGVENRETAIELYRFYLSIAPLLLAISSNSPFFQSERTGLHSVRSTFFESMPSGGHPPILSSWSEYEGLLGKLFYSKSIQSHKDLWWDVRPSPHYGTIEIRSCDIMPTIKENATLIALIHLLGNCYLHNKELKLWPHLAEWSYRENKWRALRYGMNFEFIFNEKGNSLPAEAYLREILSLFRQTAADLGYQEKIDFLEKEMLVQTPSLRDLNYVDQGSTLQMLVARNCNTFQKSVLG